MNITLSRNHVLIAIGSIAIGSIGLIGYWYYTIINDSSMRITNGSISSEEETKDKNTSDNVDEDQEVSK